MFSTGSAYFTGKKLNEAFCFISTSLYENNVRNCVTNNLLCRIARYFVELTSFKNTVTAVQVLLVVGLPYHTCCTGS